MAGTSQDVEAGRAFIKLTLDRTGYDKQVADLERSRGSSEAGSSIAGGVARNVARGAAAQTGVIATTTAMRKLGVEAAKAAPSIAATGVAANSASTGFSALWAAAAPIVLPLAAIAAAAGTVWLAVAKWDDLPLIVKALMLAIAPLIIVIRAAVLAFKSLRLAVNAVTAPFRLVTTVVRGFFAIIRAIPAALIKMAGLLRRVAVAAATMAVKVAKSAGEMAARVTRSAVEIGKSAAAIPGQIARSTSGALQSVGRSLLRIGSIASGIKLAIVGGATLAAQSWARYGERIRGVQNDLLRFNLTAEEASIIARVSDQTGESMERLARDMRDGTRDFSRWRNEMQLSGNLMSGAGLSAALELSRAFFSLRMSVVGLKDTIASALGPELTEGAELLTGIVRAVTKWASANKPLIVQVFKVASAVGSAAIALTTLGGVLSGAGAVVSPFVAGLAVLAGVMTAVEIHTGAGRSLWESYGGSVRRVVGGVLQDLGQMMEFADRVIGGVTDALIAGDLAGAVDVMWAGAKVAWTSALLEIDKLTSGTFGGIIQSLISGQWSAAGESAMNALRIAWLTGVTFLSGVWDQVVTAADTAWTGVLTGFDNLMASMKLGLGTFYNWAVANVINPLLLNLSKVPGVDFAFVRGVDLTPDKAVDREGALAERQAARDRASFLARTAHEQKIWDLRRKQAELNKQGGEEAKQQQTANQKALSDAIEAAKAAREAAAENKLKEEDFAVSRDVQSIARFSGEALGLSVGRDGPAEKTAKLTADQLKEMKGLRIEIRKNNTKLQQLLAMGGFK